ncbi:MAG: hypothetical protein A4E51_00766 [Methanosaeta sp. PtaU1.Bin055]|nr:MAG: hypothetical protein A4E51_00766 [Methanosaeta sp. PtaU1.Bin055]
MKDSEGGDDRTRSSGQIYGSALRRIASNCATPFQAWKPCGLPQWAQVDPSRGFFQFNAEYDYLVEDGECTKMVRDVSFSRDILSTLH